jgi:hypothetical protein
MSAASVSWVGRWNPNGVHRKSARSFVEVTNLRAILGIDAAETIKQPSGIALVAEKSRGWECVAVEPSYSAFIECHKGFSSSWPRTLQGSTPDPDRLLFVASKLLDGESVTLVAVDIPMANVAIDSRRVADDQISSQFGGNWCSAHSPNTLRPGPVSEVIKRGFGGQGYKLATVDTPCEVEQRLIEVFPHVALLELLKAHTRICYKVGKTVRYWPGADISARKKKLTGELERILSALKREIRGVSLKIPTSYN